MDFKGVASEAYDECSNLCTHRLSALLRTRHGEVPFGELGIEERLDAIIKWLYPEDADSPYAMESETGLTFRPWREVGVTP